jgi:hypothetical protein
MTMLSLGRTSALFVKKLMGAAPSKVVLTTAARAMAGTAKSQTSAVRFSRSLLDSLSVPVLSPVSPSHAWFAPAWFRVVLTARKA